MTLPVGSQVSDRCPLVYLLKGPFRPISTIIGKFLYTLNEYVVGKLNIERVYRRSKEFENEI